MHFKKIVSVGFSVCSFAILSACSGGDSSNSDASKVTLPSYELTFTNLTSNQPMSPLAIAFHGADYAAWTVGQTASLGLETLAESGSGTSFLLEATDAGASSTAVGAGLIMPGNEEIIELTSSSIDELKITLATMLVNTNDAFVGKQGVDLNSLSVGDEVDYFLPVYDAGTEGNSELTGTIPGPADGGEGFNVLRDDVNVVAMHPGIVSNQDGYSESVLDSTHRFDSPAAKLSFKRTQ